jgi:uncharacterized protein
MRALPVGLLAFSMVVVLGCSFGVDRDLLADVEQVIADGRPQEAATYLVERGQEAYGERNRLLYHMDLGMALHLAGDYRRSAVQFERADRLGADLYTRSLSSETGALLTNDLVIPYAGEDFERILVNVFASLNYLFVGEVEEALVEVRRIDARLRSYRENRAGRYRAEGFALYLSGLLYEVAGALDDALIAYRKAYATYGAGAEDFGTLPPKALARDVVRLAGMMEMEASPDVLAAAGGTIGPGPRGEIVVLHYFGPGPRKIERVIEVSLSRGMAMAQAVDVHTDDEKKLQQSFSMAKGMVFDNQVTVAYPVFEQPSLAVRQANVSVTGCGQATSVLVMDISTLAKVSLEDRMERDLGRIVARAVMKFLSARLAGKAAEKLSGNAGIGVLVKLLSQGAASATEAADVRGWRTLPAAIHMTRLRCDAGLFDVHVEHYGGQRGNLAYHFPVEIADDKKSFLVVASY